MSKPNGRKNARSGDDEFDERRDAKRRAMSNPDQRREQEAKTERVKQHDAKAAENKQQRRTMKQQQVADGNEEDGGSDGGDSWATVSSDGNDYDVDEPFEDGIEEIIEGDGDDDEEAPEEGGDEEEDEDGVPKKKDGSAMKNVRFADPEGAEKLMNSDTVEDEEKGRVWRGGELQKDQELEYSNRAYSSFHQLRLEYPCLSFEILKDNLGEGRTKYPADMTLVCGTQADQMDKNELVVLHVSNICRTKHDVGDDESDDDVMGDDEDSDEDDPDLAEVNNGEPVVEMKSIAHRGAVNRIRSNPSNSCMVATWSEAGTIQVFDLSNEVRSMVDQKNWATEQAATWTQTGGKGAPALKFTSSKSTHRTEGYGLDWSSKKQNWFASGDCNGQLFVWVPTQDGRWAPSGACGQAPGSIEEIKWSAIQDDYLITACAGGIMCVWDVRDLSSPKLTWQAAESDINVCDWSKFANSSHILVTGAEDGAVSVWDLRSVMSSGGQAAPLQTLDWHKGQKVISVEFSKHNESVISVVSDDGQCTLWDLSLERDADEEKEVLGDLFGKGGTQDLPDQLMFQHQGLVHPREAHFHPQIPGMVVTADFMGLHLFKPMNWRSLMK